MKIAIDGYEANVPQRLGSSQVAFELLKNLEKIDKENNYTVFLPNSPMNDLPKEREGWKYRVLKPNKFWTRVALPLALYKSREKFDLVFSPTHYIPRFSPFKRIATIFDLSYLHFPEMFLKKDLWKLTNWTKYSATSADHIITISEFSKKDIIKNYSLPAEKITVAYPGHRLGNGKYPQIKDDSYIIYIGTIQPRKNLLRLIEAFKELGEVKLMIVGKAGGEGREGWKYKEILEAPKSLGIEDRVKFLGFLEDEKLERLLSGALAYIQPSLYEGFGIPTVDAMSLGVPVLVSNVSSLPEIIGNAGLTFDPYSIESIRDTIKKVIDDRGLREKLSKEGLKQSKKFSWEKMARKVLEVFKKYE